LAVLDIEGVERGKDLRRQANRGRCEKHKNSVRPLPPIEFAQRIIDDLFH
jgi:hypothetical protein